LESVSGTAHGGPEGQTMTHTVSKIVSDETLNRIVQIESAGNLRARAPTSSALGLFQFLNATWLAAVAKHRPDLLEGRTRAQVLALRTDPTVGIEIGARFTEDNAEALGPGCTDGDLYLAHFLGLGAARRFLRARPSAAAAALAGDAAVKANRSILAGKTAGQVRAWASNCMRRWEAAGRPDWIAKYYDPDSELAAPADWREAVEDARPATLERSEDEAEAPKPLMRSKIAQAGAGAGLLGGTEVIGQANEAAEKVKTLKENAADIGITDWLGHFVLSPRFLIGAGIIVLAGLAIYWRWRDHGRGSAA
jgi:hypothetical protein